MDESTHHPVTTDSYVRPSIKRDIRHVAANMRPEDVEEVRAAGDMLPAEALWEGFTSSKPCWTYVVQGRPAAMFGVSPVESEGIRWGCIWLLGTPDVATRSLGFMRHSKRWLPRLAEDYDMIGNYVDARNESHVRYLRSLGFQLLPAEPFGHEGLPFHPFSLVVSVAEAP